MEHRLGEALLELDSITRRLRRECPWDREQDERSIVPHTVEEAYELAEAAHAGDHERLRDELGDVLFQVCFLALLLEERGEGDLDAVARGTIDKLVRRHPHVFADSDRSLAGLPTAARTAKEVRANWDAIKRSEPHAAPDPLEGVPPNLPALMYAGKLQRRACGGSERPEAAGALGDLERSLSDTADAVRADAVLAEAVRAEAEEEPPARAGHHGSERLYRAIGDLLFAVVALSRAVEVDPEIALRHRAERFKHEARGAR
jgi:MazG family protein